MCIRDSMRPSKKSLPILKVNVKELIDFTGLAITDRWVRQLAKDGHYPAPESGLYDLKATVQGLIKYYREQKETLAQMKKAIADEEHRKKKRENDIADGLVVSKAFVVAEHRKVAEPIKQMLRQKLENEYPLAVAGLDVPQARIYGKRLEDDVLSELQKAFSKFEV